MYSQNFTTSSSGLFYNNPRTKYYAPFPKAPHKLMSTNNTFKKFADKSYQRAYSSQTLQFKPNKFTYIGKNINPLMSKNNLPANSLSKPPVVLNGVNKFVYKNNGNVSSTALSCKVACLQNLDQNCIKNQSVDDDVIQCQKMIQNAILPINDKTKSVSDINSASNDIPTKCLSNTAANIMHKTNPLEVQPPSESVVKQGKNGTVCPDATKHIGNALSFGSDNVTKSLRSIENNFNLDTNRGENVKLLAQKQVSNIVSSKVINKFATNIPASKYKFVKNKNSPFVKQILNNGRRHELAIRSLKYKKDIAINIARNKLAIKNLEKKILLARKKAPVKEAIVKQNNNITKTVMQHLPKVNTIMKATPSSSSGVRKLTLNKYKIVNKNKSPTQTCNSKTIQALNKVRASSSKYKVINKNTLKDNKVSEDKSAKTEPVANKLLKQKISQLKLIKTSNYEGYDLTDISPEELVAMDESSLFQLSAMLKSTNNKRQSLVKKSKYKLVSKNSSSKQAVRMIKAKYQSKNRKSLQRSWNIRQSPISCKGTVYYQRRFKNEYQKHIVSGHPKFRSLQLLKYNRYRKTNFAVVGDIRYRVSRTKMTKTTRKSLSLKHAYSKKSPKIIIVRGERFRMDPSGKSLKRLSNANCSNKTPVKRIDLGGRTYVGTSPGILMQTNSPQIRNLASRVLHRSIQTAWTSATKKNLKKNNVYCMFYNRFGKCNRGKNCPYTHDPSKIAVCTRFLRGTCKEKDCPFSHTKSPGKMAICSYFLQDLCTNKECPYRHELLNPDAKLCSAFVRGYCSLGIKCTKAHVLICPRYFQGQCEKGASCAYPHPPRKEKKEENTELKISDEKICNQDDTLPIDSSDEEAIRYFDLRSFLSKEASCKKREAESVEQKTKKFKSFPCPPKRNKILDCPLYIPLSFDEDSH